MNEILHRMVAANLAPSEGRVVEGVVVPYGTAAKVQDPGGPAYVEVFERGAFTRSLKAPNRVHLLFEHRDGLTDRIGRALTLEEDDAGLRGSFKVVEGMIGDHALALVDEGMLAGFSVGFVPLGRSRRNTKGEVVRSRCHLADVSLVPEPAYSGAMVTARRSKAELENALELQGGIDEEQAERLRRIGIELTTD